MPIDLELALERVLSEGDEWRSWRALRVGGDDPGPMPAIPGQDPGGAFTGPSGRPSPGATGQALCQLVVLGVGGSGPAAMAGDWLEEAQTPARAWLDAPEDVPGELDSPAGAKVWATAAAACALLALGRDPGARAMDLLRGEADVEGRFTGGAYPTFAAAGAYWQVEGPKTEMAEWGLRWAREWDDEGWGPAERTTALTFWGAAGVPAEHPSVELFAEELLAGAPPAGWPGDLEPTLLTIELLNFFGG